MKKSKLFVLVSGITIVTTIAVVSVTAITANFNTNNSPTPNVYTNSSPEESSAPTEKDMIRREIKNEFNKKKDKIRKEMIANGKDSKDATFDADEQVLIEQVNEVADILKKYNILDKQFTFQNIDDNITGMKAACNLLNSSENITIRERAMIELYLEDNYYVLSELEGHKDLMKEIESTVNLPF